MPVAEQPSPEQRRSVLSLLASGLRQGFLDAYTGDSLKTFFLFHIRVFTLLMFLSLAILVIASASAAAWQFAANGFSPENRFDDYSDTGQAWADAAADATDPVATAEAAADAAVVAAAAADAAARAAGEAPTSGSYRIIEPAPPLPPCLDGSDECQPWERAWETEP